MPMPINRLDCPIHHERTRNLILHAIVKIEQIFYAYRETAYWQLVLDEQGVATMGVETAFLVGVLVGQWVMFFAMWRYVSRLLKQLTLKNSEHRPGNPSLGEIIDIPPDNFWDDDLL
jgi:hypothetical protein